MTASPRGQGPAPKARRVKKLAAPRVIQRHSYYYVICDGRKHTIVSNDCGRMLAAGSCDCAPGGPHA